MPQAVIIGQDEGIEIRVQALVQSGRRRVDIRVWRRGSSGFAPSRSGLTLDVADLDALRDGIGELLRISRNGTDVGRIVGDNDARRLHAEIAPFGAHHVARFGFWQRVRNTWRAADDGLVVSAARLPALQQTLPRFRPWLAFPRRDEQQDAAESGREDTVCWPPGADWLTIEAGAVAFHPRGIRITATPIEDAADPRMTLHQWRRDESLWVPDDSAVELPASIMETLLAALGSLGHDCVTEGNGQQQIPVGERTIWLHCTQDGEFTVQHRAGAADSFAVVLTLPAEHIPRFGRFLLESWSLLVDRLSEEAWPEPDVEPAVFNAVPEVRSEEMSAGPGAASTTTVEADIVPETVEQDHDEGLPEPVPLVPLGTTVVDERHLVFSHLGMSPEGLFLVRWDRWSLEIPTRYCDDIVADLRTLYYDALVGRRHSLAREAVGIRVSVHNQGTRLCLVLEQGHQGTIAALTIPGNEVPMFLNAVEAALSHL